MQTETRETEATVPELQPPESQPLRRSRSRRMLAGVAGGIADRFDIDVSLVRVAFVVLAFAWGAGAILYIAMWALVPRSADAADSTDPSGEQSPGEPTAPWLAFVLLGTVLAFGVLVLSSWWGGPRWGGGFGVLALVFLFGLLVAAIAGPKGSFSIRRGIAILLAGFLSLAVLAIGTLLVLVAWSGVPIAGGVGQRLYAPVTLQQVQPTYRLAVGSLTVDLRRVHFAHTGKPVSLTASVAVGVVTVEVPPNVVVDVTAHSGVGRVTTNTGTLGSFGGALTGGSTAPTLLLTVEAGVGQVELVRSLPGQ